MRQSKINVDVQWCLKPREVQSIHRVPDYKAPTFNVNVTDFAIALPFPLRKFLRGAVICYNTPTQGNRDAFNARLKQSGVLVQVVKWLM